jgi:tRNA(His) 5'-end guanylyltransferase
LIKKYSDKNDVKEILSSFSMDEKINILKSKCDIDYDDYSVEFRRGSACYRVPKIYDEGNLKYKWEVNKNLPSFQNDHSLLSSILKNGVDVIRTVNI